MNLNELEEKIRSNDIEAAVDIIEKIGRNKNIETVPMLIKYLMNTTNNIIRNSIAIALSDMGSVDAIEPLVNLLKDTKTIGSRGTLLYALEAFDCSDYAEFIVDLLSEDDFEVSRQAMILLEHNVNKISVETKQKCIQKIQAQIENLSDKEDKFEFLSDSLEILM